ncbi:hypothetical protein LTR28_011157 [Elasticomyces elasticus]|nr:hypothetical protein LTR28_011157 [Elasticomyces elasticus]
MIPRNRRGHARPSASIRTPNNPPRQPSTPEQTMDETPHYPRDARDVYHAAFLLRQVLVPDLVPIILDHAEYWVCASSAEEKDQTVASRDSPLLYLTSAPIRRTCRSRAAVKKVVFTITSHDQGYCSFPEAGNWTWFTAVRRRPLSSSSSSSAEDASQPSLPNQSELVLTSNTMANHNFETHTIAWPDDESPGQSEGATRDWVRGLATGDQIEVNACARFDGWMNYVRRVRVDVFTSAVA